MDDNEILDELSEKNSQIEEFIKALSVIDDAVSKAIKLDLNEFNHIIGYETINTINNVNADNIESIKQYRITEKEKILIMEAFVNISKDQKIPKDIQFLVDFFQKVITMFATAMVNADMHKDSLKDIFKQHVNG